MNAITRWIKTQLGLRVGPGDDVLLEEGADWPPGFSVYHDPAHHDFEGEPSDWWDGEIIRMTRREAEAYGAQPCVECQTEARL